MIIGPAGTFHAPKPTDNKKTIDYLNDYISTKKPRRRISGKCPVCKSKRCLLDRMH